MRALSSNAIEGDALPSHNSTHTTALLERYPSFVLGGAYVCEWCTNMYLHSTVNVAGKQSNVPLAFLPKMDSSERPCFVSTATPKMELHSGMDRKLTSWSSPSRKRGSVEIVRGDVMMDDVYHRVTLPSTKPLSK